MSVQTVLGLAVAESEEAALHVRTQPGSSSCAAR